MQSTTSQKLSEDSFWWPSPEALEMIEISDIEDGWELSAPDGTELADWIAHWNQDEDHHALFQDIFVRALTDHANLILNTREQNGETEITDGQHCNSEKAESECPR